MYLAIPITFHFEKIMRLILKKEEMYLSNIKFKNLYIIDLDNEDILFNMQDMNGNKKYNHIHKNEALWQELLFHSKKLRHNYLQNHNYKFDSNMDLSYYVTIY